MPRAEINRFVVDVASADAVAVDHDVVIGSDVGLHRWLVRAWCGGGSVRARCVAAGSERQRGQGAGEEAFHRGTPV